MATYNYTKAPVNLDRLFQEIDNSSIAINYDKTLTSVLGDRLTVGFKASLSENEKSTLDEIVENHSGDPLSENCVQKVSLDGIDKTDQAELALKVSTTHLEGSSTLLVSHNFCDPTTWYTGSILANYVTLTPDVTNKIFQYIPISTPVVNWINLGTGQIPYGERLLSTYNPVVKVNGETVSSGYTIDYVNGTITFADEQIGTVTCKFYYAGTSEWKIAPIAGKKLKMLGTSVKFKTGCSMGVSQKILFQAFMGNYPIGAPTIYDNIDSLELCSSTVFEGKNFTVFKFDYLTSKILPLTVAPGIIVDNIKIKISDDQPLTGTKVYVLADVLSI